MDTDPDTRREEIIAEVHALATEFAHTYHGFEDSIVSAFYVVGEIIKSDGKRTRIEMADPQSSRHTAMGLLFAALHDQRWL